jgi:hypothetical protein
LAFSSASTESILSCTSQTSFRRELSLSASVGSRHIGTGAARGQGGRVIAQAPRQQRRRQQRPTMLTSAPFSRLSYNIIIKMVSFCLLRDNFYCWEQQTPVSGLVVACTSYAPMQLRCQNRQDAISSQGFYPAGVNFDEEAVEQNQQGRGVLVPSSVLRGFL